MCICIKSSWKTIFKGYNADNNWSSKVLFIKLKYKMKSSKAFTLVEMLIVVVIIGILASALIPRLTWAQWRARDAARKSALNQLSTALSTYFSDNGVYTGSWCADDLAADLVPDYITSIPRDPQAGRKVIFWTNGPDNFCTKEGSYWVLPLKRNGADNAGVVLVANTETPWTNSNFVLAAGSSDSRATTNWFQSSSCNGNNEKTACFAKDVEATTVEPTICPNGVKIGDSVVICNVDSSINQGVAQTNSAMVYVVLQ